MRSRLFAISDLHLSINNPKPMDIFGGNWQDYIQKIKKDWDKKVKDNDIVVIAGDISWAMTLNEAIPDLQFLSTLKGHKIIIKGNHDYWWGTISNVRRALPDKIYALQNDSLKIGKYVFCGSRGWMLPDKKSLSEQDNKIYQREQLRLKMSIDSARKILNKREKLVCIMHYPPFNSRLEDSEFTKIIEDNNVKTVIYGHLHGKSKSTLVTKRKKTTYYLTSCDKVNNSLVRIK